MLTTSSFRDLKVADVARRMGTSPGTFYHYFPDIETAVLALVEEMAGEGAYLRDLVKDHDWTIDNGRLAAEELVNGFLDFWRKYGPLLGVLDLAALEGDRRFSTVRVHMLNAVTVALADVMDRLAQSQGASERRAIPSLAVAGALVGMLAHNAAYQDGFRLWQISLDQLRAAMVDIVRASITSQADGRPAPGARHASSKRSAATDAP
jgi:AcrR family transcriptional regulator